MVDIVAGKVEFYKVIQGSADGEYGGTGLSGASCTAGKVEFYKVIQGSADGEYGVQDCLVPPARQEK